MSPALRFELHSIHSDQRRLHGTMAELDRRIELMSRRMIAQPSPPAATLAHVPAPPPLPVKPAAVERTPSIQSAPPIPQSTGTPKPAPERAKHSIPQPETATPSESGGQPSDSLELVFGTVWFARIGIVILLTGLVFLGNYAWQHIVSHLGAGGKLTLLYLAGALLGGAGAWLERGRESMRNYARVLIAGGAATIYYATYAAHFVDRLRVIDNPILGGTLLLVLACGFIAYADRKKSQAVALLAILLAYYTSAINAIGSFTLFSGLLLGGAATFLLIRHRWAALGWLSVVGTYGSYLFWRFHSSVQPGADLSLGEASWVTGVAFLASYWIVFTVALFVGNSTGVNSARPALFSSANNGLFFGLAALQVAQHRPDRFWLLALIFGSVLLGCAAVARSRRTDQPSIDGSFLAQGLALLTLAAVSKLTGYHLALTLALESALLLAGSGRRHGWVFEIGAALTAAAACGIAIAQSFVPTWSNLLCSIAVTGALFGDAVLLKLRRKELGAYTWNWAATWFIALALALVVWMLSRHVTGAQLPIACAIVAIAATALIARVRIPELLLAQLFPFWGIIPLAFENYPSGVAMQAFSHLLLTGTLLGMEQWWQRQRMLAVEPEGRGVVQFASAAGALIVLAAWLQPVIGTNSWMAVAAITGFATLLYGILSRGWATALLGQVFTALALQTFISSLFTDGTSGWIALAPVTTLALSGWLLEMRAPGSQTARIPAWVPTAEIAKGFRLAAIGALALWAIRFVPNEWTALFFAATGALFIAAGAATYHQGRARLGMVYQGFALAACWAGLAQDQSWLQFLAILAVPATLRVIRRLADLDGKIVSESLRTTMTGAATITAFAWVTMLCVREYGPERLTVAWSAFALLSFAAGLGLKDRVYRLAGFGVLAIAIGRVFLFDVWRLETLYRILSFLVLGGVLLLLGFVYNRFAESIRKWL